MRLSFVMDNHVLEEAALHATSAIHNLRLLSALGRVQTTLAAFKSILDRPRRSNGVLFLKVGLAAAFSELSKFSAYALAFYDGSRSVDEKVCGFTDMLVALNAVLLCATFSGVYASLLPPIGLARVGAAHIRALINSLEVGTWCAVFFPFFVLACCWTIDRWRTYMVA